MFIAAHRRGLFAAYEFMSLPYTFRSRSIYKIDTLQTRMFPQFLQKRRPTCSTGRVSHDYTTASAKCLYNPLGRGSASRGLVHYVGSNDYVSGGQWGGHVAYIKQF